MTVGEFKNQLDEWKISDDSEILIDLGKFDVIAIQKLYSCKPNEIRILPDEELTIKYEEETIE